MKKQAWVAASLLSCIAAVGCSDGHPCTLKQDEDGAAVIRCPDGSSARVLPGIDGDDLAQRCEIESRDSLSWLVCGEIEVPLPTDETFCLNGLQTDLVWPPYSAEGYTHWQLFEELKCSKLRGSLIIHERSVDLPEVIEQIQDVQSLEITSVAYGESIELPNLKRASSVSVTSNTSLKSVNLSSLQGTTDSVYVFGNDALETFSLSIGKGFSVGVSGNNALTELNVSVGEVSSMIIEGVRLQNFNLTADKPIAEVFIWVPYPGQLRVTANLSGTVGYLGIGGRECLSSEQTETASAPIRAAIAADVVGEEYPQSCL